MIGDKLEERGKNLIIKIDDIDRLSGKEILSVLKLVRNTANFKNTVYLLGYDNEYVTDMLRKERISNPNRYIQKIINIHYDLSDKVEKNVKDYYRRILCDKWGNIDCYTNDIDRFIDFLYKNANVRIVKRLANTINISKLQNVALRLNLYDFLLLQYLHLEYGVIYEELKRMILDNEFNYYNLICYDSTNLRINLYTVSPLDTHFQNKDGKDTTIKEDAYIKDKLKPKMKSYDDSEIKLVYDVLSTLFPCKADSIGYLRISYSVCYKEYFAQKENAKILKINDFNEIIKTNNKTIITDNLKNWISQGIINLDNLIEYLNYNYCSKDVLDSILEVIYPQSHVINDNSKNKGIQKEYTVPGIMQLKYNNNKINDKYVNVMVSYLNNISFDNLFQQRFVLLSLSKYIFQYERRLKPYIDSKQININNYRYIGYDELIKDYTKVYLDNTDSYVNFNPDFWACLRDVDDRDIYKGIQEMHLEHITKHQKSFDENIARTKELYYSKLITTPFDHKWNSLDSNGLKEEIDRIIKGRNKATIELTKQQGTVQLK